MRTRRYWILGCFAAGFIAAQNTPATLQIVGAVKQTLSLSPDDLAKMPRAFVKTTNNGMETVYEGVRLHEILKKAGVPQGGGQFCDDTTVCVRPQNPPGWRPTDLPLTGKDPPGC